MLVMDFLLPLIMVVFGKLFQHCPGKINSVFGYRTRRSMASQEAWNFAHHACGKLWFRWGLVLLPVTVGLMLLLYGFINHTRIGTAIRAVAIDQDTAKLMGINVDNIISMIFLIGPALGGAAGVMMGLYYGQITYDMGFSFGLKAFTAAILGGIGNIPGAMIGGLLLGFIEIMTVAFMPSLSGYRDAFAFVVLVLVLLVRPTGPFGQRSEEKI